MKWIPSPTNGYSDPRLAEAGDAAELLHRRAWDWSGDHETDGFVPASMLARLQPAGTQVAVDALVRVGMWEAMSRDGLTGFRFTSWDAVLGDMRSLQHRRAADRQRQAKKRQVDRAKTTSDDLPERDESADSSQGVSRDNPHAEEIRENPPTPRQAGGTNCDPVTQPHTNCRGCGTTRRRQRQAADLAASAAAVQADLDLRSAAKNAPWCGDCDPNGRWMSTPTGDKRCPACNEVELLKRANRPPLVAVAGAR